MVIWSGCSDGGRSHRDGLEADVVMVRVVGAAGADEVWSAVECALESAEGRTVVVDLRWLAEFEQDTVEALVTVARTSRRRRDDVRLIVRSGAPIESHLYRRGVPDILAVDHGLWSVLRRESDRQCRCVPAVQLHA